MSNNSKPTLLILLLYLSVCYHQVNAQNMLSYPRYVVDTLSSPYMGGRGYVEKGDKRAALFIAGEFKKMGLDVWDTISSGENPYFQNFHLDVNTFPGENECLVK